MGKQTERNILVTGGAGYIGSITVKKLCDAGYKIIVVDSLENGHKEAVDQRAILEVSNVGDKSAMSKIFDHYNPIAVIDFAAYLAVGESMEQPEKYLKNNVLNFINLLDVMKAKGCEYIIKSSTASTYGEPLNDSDFPLKEEYTENFIPDKSSLLPGAWKDERLEGESFLNKFIKEYNQTNQGKSLPLTDREVTKLRIPASIYGLTKLLDEIILKKYDDQFGLRFITLRYFNVAGADPSGKMGEDKPNPTNLMTLTIYKALGKRDKLTVFGNDYPTSDGTGIRDYIHVCDLADGHIKALEYLLKNKASQTVNLGVGKGSSVLEVIKAAEKACGFTIEFEIGPRRSGDPAISFSDPTKAKKLLDWVAKYSIEDMAKSAWEWHKNHPEGYKNN